MRSRRWLRLVWTSLNCVWTSSKCAHCPCTHHACTHHASMLPCHRHVHDPEQALHSLCGLTIGKAALRNLALRACLCACVCWTVPVAHGTPSLQSNWSLQTWIQHARARGKSRAYPFVVNPPICKRRYVWETCAIWRRSSSQDGACMSCAGLRHSA